MKYLIRGAHLVDPKNGVDGLCDVAVENGTVAAVAPTLEPSGAPVLDAGGLHLFPGLIDVHVHLREPGQEYKETVATGTRAAAAGGFTGVACMPNTAPVNDEASVTRYILEKAEAGGVCRVYPVGAISTGLKGVDLAAIGEQTEAGCVAITDDGRPVDSPMLMRRAMEYAKRFGLTVLSHCEDLALEKRSRLAASGVPRGALRLAIVFDKRHLNSHCVLTVETSRGTFILDTFTNRVGHWDKTPYNFEVRERADGQWDRFDQTNWGYDK